MYDLNSRRAVFSFLLLVPSCRVPGFLQHLDSAGNLVHRLAPGLQSRVLNYLKFDGKEALRQITKCVSGRKTNK